MANKIVLFGATGYTGELTAQALVDRGAKPVLAGRSRTRLEALAQKLGGLDVAVADVADPDSVRELVERGDVLIATVGPFRRFGAPAVQAAIASGAHYIDSTGEPPFIREVFERYGAGAQAAGCGLITAFGYDWVPGNLAGALALEQAGDEAVRVDTGYFIAGKLSGATSGGTQASLAGALIEPSYAWRGGRLVTVRSADRVRKFTVGGRQLSGIAVGASENFALPHSFPNLREVNSYLGWFGPLTPAVPALSAVGEVTMRLPGVRRGLDRLITRFIRGSTGGPDAASRAASSSHVVGAAYAADGRQLSEVHLDGVNGYTFTGEMLAWGAIQALEHGLKGTGALGPVEAFGLEALREGAASAGISQV